MAIRITGMYSGLDTEAIISELVSAQSVKKNKYVKDQTKLSWKMDAWKALNTKIYNFYTNTLDNLRWQSSYMKKAVKVSNSNAISVIPGSNAVNGSQSVKVWELAQTGKLTGRDLSEGKDGINATGSTKLSDLGFNGDASFDVTVGGKTTTIKADGNTKISDLVKQLQNVGLNASFDDVNHRFFISAKESGAAADFSITANNEAGLNALNALGLLTEKDLKNSEYAQWASYKTDEEAYNELIKNEVAKRAASYKKANDALMSEIDKLKTAGGYGDEDDMDTVVAGLQTDRDSLQGDLDSLKQELDAAQAALKNAPEDYDTENDPNGLKAAVDAAQAALDAKQEALDEKDSELSAARTIADKEKQYNDNASFYEVDEDGKIIGKDALNSQVREEFDAKVDIAYKIANGEGYDTEKLGIRIVGQDAEIEVDGARFKSSSNDFNINGMTITAYEKTDNYVTITTSNDVDGIYDMIKNFFTEYNSLINEMSALYNADSAKGYDPLLTEEKADLTDTEIEEWEKKIKDSLLRRDSTLGDLTDAIKIVMMQGATVNGKTMYLSDFGINTLGYFNAGENEKGAYHIDGDPDDADVNGNTDMLKTMIANDPDAVMNFFSGLSRNLYDKLTEKMSAVKDTSSAFTVYNDKLMQKEYNDYKDKIAKEEEKLNALMDKWYARFSQMETALAKLQSKSGGLSSLFGGS